MRVNDEWRKGKVRHENNAFGAQCSSADGSGTGAASLHRFTDTTRGKGVVVIEMVVEVVVMVVVVVGIVGAAGNRLSRGKVIQHCQWAGGC